MLDTLDVRSLTLNGKLFLCTSMILNQNAEKYPFNVALQKLREREEDLLERLEGAPTCWSKDNLMAQLEAIRAFKQDHGIL